MFYHAYIIKFFYEHRSFNHTVGELFGLHLFCKIFEEIKPFDKWERNAFYEFKKQFILQIRADGTHLEQSVNYHRFVLEYFSLFVILNPNRINEKERNIVQKMFDYLLLMIKPNRKIPLIGDSDNGKVLFLTYFKNDSIMDLLNLGVILFQRADLKYISNIISPISILLLGEKGCELYNKLKVEEPKKRIEYFNNAGYIVIRNNWTEKANYLFVDYGKFGAQYAGHSHSSITNFIYSYNGMDVIIDSGTYSYNKSLNERNFFRSSRAHNILTINHENQAIIKPYFGWENIPKIKRKIEIMNNNIELICVHNGFKGFLVKRKISTNPDLNKIIIKDIVYQTRDPPKKSLNEITLFFHFDKNTFIKLENNLVILNNIICMRITSKQDFDFSVKNSIFSPYYGFKYKNKMLKILFEYPFGKSKTVEIITEIKPY